MIEGRWIYPVVSIPASGGYRNLEFEAYGLIGKVDICGEAASPICFPFPIATSVYLSVRMNHALLLSPFLLKAVDLPIHRDV